MKADRIENVYALSPSQAGILFHTLYATERGMYLDRLVYVLEGDVRVSVFKSAWQYLIDRHPILRTSFHWEELEEPVQVVHGLAEPPLETCDWSSLSGEEQHASLQTFLKEDGERGMDLTQAPLMRLTLIRTGRLEWRFVWTFNHLLLDRWSISQILSELTAAYDAIYHGRRIDLPPVQPFGNYIGWLLAQDEKRAESYWRETLAGFHSPTLLPMDRDPSGRLARDMPASQRLQISEETTLALLSLARRHRLTLNTLLQGAWALLLSRYSGEEDVVFGATVSGRPASLPGVETIVGMFINSLPVRVQVRPDEPLLPWLQRLQDNQATMREYEYSSLVQIHGWSPLPRGVQLFDSLVTVQNTPVDHAATEQPGALKLRSAGGEFSRGFALSLTVGLGRQLRLTLSHDTCRYDADDVVRMLAHLSRLLDAMAADPQCTLADLPMLTDVELRQLLVEWNATETEYPRDQCVQELFESQVERTPDAIAVRFEGKHLTYLELNERANQVARYLQKLGVGPDVLVGLCLDRSLEMVMGLLGVLKAGGAYVPLDPSYPLDRLAFMLDDSQIPVLLSREACVDVLPNSWAHLVCLDTDWALIGGESKANPGIAVTADNLAYVIYTSGTTGQPKGAMIRHGGLTNYLTWCSAAYRVQEGEGSPVHSSLSFDLTVTSVFPALLAGRTVWLLDEAAGVEALSGVLRQTGDFSLIKITPAHLELLSRELSYEEAAGRTRAFVVGGEMLLGEQLAFWREHAPQTRLINEYGPTETVVGCCVYECEQGRSFDYAAGVPIGRPIANTRLYVLDSRLKPVAIGVVGELYIGGDGLARGYLNRPDLTAEKFVPDPFAPEAGSRLYRTGDLVRWRADGILEFLGRIDHQVKLRGFRIELGEIESVLLQHPSVRESVVAAREDVAGDKRLVAYVVGRDGIPNISDLREHLKTKLPEYMVPSAFAFLDALPLSPNGKVDRKALPAPETNGQEDEFVAPRTPIEEALAEIWRDVLRIDRAGIHDSFFELGGHSLLATQVISRIRAVFQVELPLHALFDAPTVAGLAEQVASARREEMPSAPVLARVPRQGALPVSYAQQRLWFLDQFEPGGSLYNIYSAVRLRGVLDEAALQSSLQEIVRRHEALRTTFALIDGEPCQVIGEVSPAPLSAVDVSWLPAEEREAEALRLVQEEAERPFDLQQGPLFRAGLLRLGEEEHILLLTMHHIVSDGWSLGVLLREMETLYKAFSAGQSSPLPELPVQYADYAAWQREWLQGETLERQISYWKEHLAGAPSLLELPTDRPRPPVQTFRGALKRFEITQELTRELKALGQQEGSTLFMTLLAAFQVLLARYSGQEDLVIGTPIANRTQSEVEGLIGFFVNTLALRGDLSGDPSFRELLARVRETALGAYAHQDLPFEKLVEELQPERSLSYSPLFQVMFSIQNAPGAALDLDDLQIESVRGEGVTAKFDLSLGMSERAGKLGMWLEYNTDLFDADRMERMLGHFQILLEGIVADPQRRISRLPLLSEPERSKLLVEWNDTQADYPRERCIHQLFEEQAERTPDAVALTFADQQLTYRQLNDRANQLAHYLRDMGVGPEVLVGLCVERSLEMVVGLLGILKAGAAYVPLDPTYPPERLAFMLEDSRATVLLTQQRLRERLDGMEARILCLDQPSLFAPESSVNPSISVTADNLAYVIYTSGTTGQPKGAMLRHVGLTNYLSWCSNAYGVEEGVGSPVHSSLSFDLTITSLFPALLCGRGVWLLAEAEGVEALFGALSSAREWSLVKITPAHLELLSRQMQPQEAAGRTHAFVVGGEALYPEQIAFWRKHAPQTRLINEYGPTETVVGCCVYECTGEEAASSWGLPIGRPIANTRLYVLDRFLQPCPVGVSGELYIGGEGLGRGYLGQADLTAGTFVPDPFGREAGSRMYRSGDLARYQSDGTLAFLGRIDTQVKVRGFRIELGEIESVLGQHPSVREAVALAREDTPGDRRLVAYVVGKEGAVDSGVLRAHLRERLPEYMVPSAFVSLELLPLTSNGKVDRKALPAPEAIGQEDQFAAPRTPIEEGLCEIWSEVLRLKQVGIHDNFFELGGHSLLATQVISRIRKTFQVQLPLRALFEAPTIGGLAQQIAAREEASAPPLVRASREGSPPLSFSQQRLWFLDQFEPGGSLFNLPSALRLTGRLNLTALGQTLQEIVRRHEALRTTFALIDSEPCQVIGEVSPAPLSAVDVSWLPAEEREAEALRLVQEEAERPFDLQQGPLFRAGLLRLGEEEHILLLTMHHIVSDGWSFAVLLREMETLYDAFQAGKSSLLSELSIQYADYAAWQREWLQGETLERQISYWKEHLAGAPSLLELPTDRPRPPVQTFRGARRRLECSEELSRAIKLLGRQEGSTLFMTLLAAFQVLLARYSGQEDLVIGTPIANRTQSEVEGLIGFFVNTLALRGDLSGDPSFRELLARVRETALGAYAHQDLPFEKLVEELQPERSMSHSPLFQVMFSVQNAPAATLDLVGLAVDPVRGEGATAKFDLNLGISERAGKLGMWLEYNTDLFDADRMDRMLGHFQILLEGIVADPQRRISRLPLLSEPERSKLLVEWNDTQADYPRERCIHQLFEEQVERTPDAVAIECDAGRLTYQQLNLRANQLAHLLRERGVKPDALVAICMQRSLEMVVALLGVLKAGGAYVAVDPAYPAERIRYTFEDAEAGIVLTQQSLLSLLPRTGAQTICLDAEATTIQDQPIYNPLPCAKPGNLAYVLYTSGSTGKPKGVAIEHRSPVALIAWALGVHSQEELSGVVFATSICFDLSVYELFVTLCGGGRLLLVENALAIADLPREWVPTLINTVPSAIAELLRQEAVPATVMTINLAGEPLSSALVDEIYARTRARKVYDLYGPSEDTTYSTWVLREPGGIASIGRPIANTQAFVLDRRLQPVPVGVPGELYIGGAGLARGYLKRPDLTAERFVCHPFGAEGAARMYRTGDLARYLPNGNLEYLGRSDHQVKIRGFRIELGEIESVLRQYPGVKDALVLAREDVPGDKRLAAYVVNAGGTEVSGQSLREYCHARLPAYMNPSAFVFLENLPLSPNGKVDRKVLPAPENAGNLEESAAPRTPIEEGLCEIWSEVLRLKQVGIRDDFFELGGHSLLATQVISRIRKTFQVQLPLRALFEGPTIAGLAEQVLLFQRSGDGVAVPPPAPISREDALPLSFAQQRLWFLDQYEPGSPLYNIPSALRLIGTLDAAALEQTVSELMRRHEVLRTTFALVEGSPVQRVQEAASERLQVVDIRWLPAEEREAEALRLAQEEAGRPFVLDRGPLFRACLIRLREEEHVLLLTMHHIVSDGWSQGVLKREIGALYNAFRSGQPSPLPDLPIQYADYAVWQREWLRGETLERQIGYWKDHLTGAPSLLALPTDRPRPPVQTFRGAHCALVLSSDVTEALKALGRREGATLFMTLLAAFQTLLHRYSGQEDIVVGTPVANRTQSETEGLIGLFMNSLALRGDLSGDPSFKELLSRVRETALGAYAHQDLPFEKLVEELQPERSLSYSPVYQVMFILQNVAREGLRLDGLQIGSLGEQGVTAKYDLQIAAAEDRGRLRLGLEYNTDLFDADRMQRLLSHFQILLEGIVADPGQRLSRLPLLSEPERSKLLVEWNDTQADYPTERCIHELFEEQVQRTPDALALTFAEQNLTYRQLNQRANQLAHYLRKLGVGPEVLVGLCLERSLEMVVGLLGILKAGGAYVPLDPSWPPERLALIAKNSRLPLVVTHSDLHEALDGNPVPRVCLDTDHDRIAEQSCLWPACSVTANNLAYVLHTSGSTGVPKGVQIPHQAVINFLVSMAKQPGIAPQDVLVAVTTISFDIAALELWLPLLFGARVVLASREEAMDAAALAALLARSQATQMQATPATWRMLLHDGWSGGGGGFKALCGGEALPSELAAALLGRCGEVWNLYGPTETTIWSSVERLEAGSGPISIGRPIANTTFYLLDASLGPVPEGVSGEIYIGGEGLGRGYLKRADLTAEKFVPDPFSLRPGARMYRTGDLGRYLCDGRIECQGRVDHQVKVRGFRIELGEIESVLSEHPGVKEAVAIVREDTAGDKRLVGYLVREAGQDLEPAELRAHLKASLPDYMLPSALVFLDALPLTANGKIDRKALPAPEGGGLAEAYVAPRTPIEEGLAQIWSEVLGVERVSAHDDFFELGGHSLLATQVISRVRQAFQVELPLRALFDAPSVAALGQALAAGALAVNGATAPQIRRAERDRPLPLSFDQQRLWFMEQLQPGNSLFNIPMALRLSGRLDIDALRHALDAIRSRHEVLRTVIGVRNRVPVQIIADSQAPHIPVIDLGAMPDDRKADAVVQLVAEESARPFDLERGPLFRCHLVRLRPDEHVMLLTLHHIVTDVTSMAIFWSEVSALYREAVIGTPAALPDLPIQYADYAVWQRECFQNGLFQPQMDYWQQQLRDAPPFLEIPTDHPRPPSPTFSRGCYRFVVSEATFRAVVQFCQEERATPFMYFMAVFKLLLSRYTGRKDILVGTDTLNRDRSETQGLIGFFINQLVLRTDLSGCASFRQLLRRVRDVALEGYTNQGLPFDKLVELLRPARDSQRPPLYQVKLTYANGAALTSELEGLSVSWIQADRETAQLDHTLFLREREGTVSGNLEYRAELYRPETIERIVRDYEKMLQAYSKNPDLSLDAHETLAGGSTSRTGARERMVANRKKLLGIAMKSEDRSGSSLPREDRSAAREEQ